MEPLISVSKLSKRYGKTLAVDDVSFELRAREVVGFLGPNGAGKSTTLRILAGYLGRSGGSVKVGGFDLDAQPIEAKKRIGYMPETVPLYGEMRVVEYLRFRAELKGVRASDRRAYVEDAMKRANVADVSEMLIAKLSKGYRQRVGLADALVAKPPILILDEPTSGLDPNQIREVRDLIKELGSQHAVLLSTHILSEVESSCDRVLVIGKGKLLAEGPTADIRNMAAPRALTAIVRGDRAAALAAARSAPQIAEAEVRSAKRSDDDDVVVLACRFAESSDATNAAEALTDAFVKAGLKVREIRPEGGGLEDVFRELTRQKPNEDAAGA